MSSEMVDQVIKEMRKLIKASQSALDYLKANPDEYSTPRAKKLETAIDKAETFITENCGR